MLRIKHPSATIVSNAIIINIISTIIVASALCVQPVWSTDHVSDGVGGAVAHRQRSSPSPSSLSSLTTTRASMSALFSQSSQSSPLTSVPSVDGQRSFNRYRSPVDYNEQKRDAKICIGTNGRMSMPSNREHHLRNLQDRFTNCTYVDGNLELTWLEQPQTDFSFLQHIREVTGYLLISRVNSIVRLPNLQIIRGRTLFKDEKYALFVAHSQMYTLEMPKLQDILAGSVGMFDNYNLCHMRSINWEEIISGPNETFKYNYDLTVPERDCPRCHASCPAGCWGEGPANCQKFSKTNCSPQCAQGRCFGPRPRECCHLFCAGGCTGPTQKDCLACRNFYDDGVCKQECPPMQKYNPTNYLWEHNPDGKYAYGATCVRQCPEHLLKDSGACVRTCPPSKMAVHGECVPCNGACPKTCTGTGAVHSGNIGTFEGCTIIEGSLEILQTTFDGFQHVYANFSFGPRYIRMHPDRLEVFSTVREITGSLNIQGAHEAFTNLSAFRNLEVIGGRQLSDTHSLYVVKTSLRFLGLQKLRSINSGSVMIVENKNLCVSNINWGRIKKSATQLANVEKNLNRSECAAAGLGCDSECTEDGCWGAGPRQCLECRHFQYNGTCLARCDRVAGLFRANAKQCEACHAECEGSCSGPGPEHCERCRSVRDGKYCVPQCPVTKYAAANGTQCLACDAACVGCTGPKDTLGAGGCTLCEKAIINEGETQQCLRKDDPCPDGFYYDVLISHDHFFQPLAGKAVCRRCHPRCKRCTSYGFHEQACQECAAFKRGEQCEDECPNDHFAGGPSGNECLTCDGECRGCSGAGAANCLQCRTLKMYNGDPLANGTTFNCTATCPPERPFKHFPLDPLDQPYCSAEQIKVGFLESPVDAPVILVCVAVIVVICAAIMCFCNQIAKRDKEQLKLNMTKKMCEDSEPLQPTNVGPNLTRVRLINEQELRRGGQLGAGAFGTVYKGLWIRNKNDKVPVAIKIPLNMSGPQESRDFLHEAYIMASVNHPNLLSLLAVCMTSEMMFVTHLMPHGSLLHYMKTRQTRPGAQVLLNWSTQIASGMAYLESLRLVHRDLAARNVLVKNDSLVKIADFGLAKLLQQDCDEYKAPGGKMPIKWLALECILNRVFTSKSDVWAFGVTIWELLTFGERPYGETPAKDVPVLLERGVRLRQPIGCSIDVYYTMLGCWHLDAGARPTFQSLVEVFQRFARDPNRFLSIPNDVQQPRGPHSPGEHSSTMVTVAGGDLDDSVSVDRDLDGVDVVCGGAEGGSNTSEAAFNAGMMSTSTSAGSDECDHKMQKAAARPAALTKMPALYEDDYLVPGTSAGSVVGGQGGVYGACAGAGADYMQVVKSPTCIDNPEYLFNAAVDEQQRQQQQLQHMQVAAEPTSPMPTQTIGIPLVPTAGRRLSHVGGALDAPALLRQQTTADPEYYNDLQKDIFPMHGETTV